MPRAAVGPQALHCAELDLRPCGEPRDFRVGLPEDMATFAIGRIGESVRPVVAKLQRSSC